jgi:hypothetical protein
MERLAWLCLTYAGLALALAVILQVSGVEARWGIPIIVVCLSVVQFVFWVIALRKAGNARKK